MRTNTRPEPKSYMTDEERAQRRAGGMSGNALFGMESRCAGHAGDEEAAWAWLARAELPAHSLAFLKGRHGADFIRSHGFNTTRADAEFGPDWLEQASNTASSPLAALPTTLERLLVIEALLEQEMAETPDARALQAMHARLARHVHAVAQSGDLAAIIEAIVDSELKRCADSPDMARRLGMALQELAVIGQHLELVADPVRYQTVNAAHSLPKNRRRGLPYDAARQAMASHGARLGNMGQSRLTAEEKAVFDARRKSLRVGQKLYEAMQARALGMETQSQ